MKDFFYDDYLGAQYYFTASQIDEAYMQAEQFKKQHPEFKLHIRPQKWKQKMPNKRGLYCVYVEGRKRKIPRNSGLS